MQIPPLGCSMERTKLSTRQIRHALPDWMFEELVEDSLERRPRRTRRGNRARRNRDLAVSSGSESNSPPASPVVFGGHSLIKTISSLPLELQRCFSEWRRERKVAILQQDLYKQQEVERVMWSAYFNITQAHMLAI